MDPLEHRAVNLNIPASELPTEPITLHEVEEEMKKRVSYIDKEITKGFNFIKNQPKSVTMFGSARFSPSNKHYKQAERLAGRFAKMGYTVITGGGPGIMEGANKGAFDAGGTSLGLNIKLPFEQSQNPYLTDNLDFYYFFTRKVMLSFSAEAYLFFPGGFGTLDEFFEILTLVQTHKIEPVPIVCVGRDFWEPLQDFIQRQMYELHNAVDKTDMSLYTITDDEDEVVTIVKKVPIRHGVRLHNNNES